MTFARGHEALDDRALVARLLEAEPAALLALYDRYGASSYALARRMLASEQAAEDVVAAVFERLWRHARECAGAGGVAAWLLAATREQVVERIRREASLRRRRTPEDAVEFGGEEAPSGDVERWAAFRRERTRAALEELPDAERAALALAYFGGYTQPEIATLTGVPVDVVRARTLAATRSLVTAFADAVEPAGGRAGNAP